MNNFSMKRRNIIRLFIVLLSFGISQILAAQACPVINSISNSTAVCVGNNITLAVNATSPDASTLTYAWFKNGSVITGATSSSYAITNFQIANADVYFVKVSNACATPTQSANITLTLKDKPSINSLTTSPATVCTGANFTIQVSGNENGGGAITYQWKKASSNIANTNGASYTLSNIQSGDASLYSVNLSNTCGNVNSSDFQLIVNQKPTITLNPTANTLLCAGATLTLNADAVSATSFKWQKDGVDIGNTSKTLTIPSVTAANAGVYTFVATNSCGTTTSGNAQVTIKDKPSITSITAPLNVCAAASATLVSTIASNGDNNLTYAWALNGTAVSNGNASTLTVPNFQSANAGTYSLSVTNSCGTVSSATNNQNVDIQLITTPSVATITDKTVCLNTNLLVPTTITNLGSTTPTYQWYFNGSAITNQTTAQLNISNVQTARTGRYYVTVNNGCSSTISSNEFNVTVLNLPSIQTQPTAQTESCASTSFTLSVLASNTQSYQWYKNDVVINTATASSFNIPSISTSDAATYKVVISNSCGYNVTSNAAVLVVKSAPTIQTTASTNTLCVGASHTLTVSALANGGGTLTYQWKKAGVNIPNATTASLALTSVQTGNAGIYTVDVTNSCGTSPSPDYTIAITQAPLITLDPVSQTVCVGATATFTANVSGSSSVKWQRNGVDVGNTTNTLSIPSIAVANTGTYTFLATNSCGTTTSADAILSVNNRPVINSLTSTSPVCAGATATITSAISANGNNNLTYAWSFGGNVIGNTATLSVPNFQSANAGTYSLVVTNSCGSTTSPTTTILQLQPTPTVANVQGQTVCLGGTLNAAPVYTNVSGSTVTYQWYFEGAAIPIQTGAQLNISNIQAAQSGRYYVAVNNGCGPVSGTPFNVTVLNLPSIQTQPTAQQQICVGSNFSLSVAANNAQTYQWYKNDILITGETTSTYSKSANSADAGTYKVVISNGCGYSLSSNNASLTISTFPTITSSPANTTVCIGQPVNVSVSATANGGGNLRYVWATGGTEIAGATSSNFTIPRASSIDNGKVYNVTVINNCGATNGGSFTLNVGDKPKDVKISTSIPNNETTGKPTVCLGSPITFSVTSESNGYNPTYTWFKDDLSYSSSSNSSLNVNPSATTDAGTYKLNVSNSCGITTSNSITIGVHEKPIISIQPESLITACELTTVTLSGLAQNKPGTNSAITYTWFRQGVPETPNGSSLVLSNLNTDESGIYQLKASNECGTTSSNNAQLIVVSKPRYSIITPSTEFAICSATNQSKTLSVNIFSVNGQTPTISWSTIDGNITAVNTVGGTANITIASVGKDATYNAVLTNGCGTTPLKNGIANGILIKNEVGTPVVTAFTTQPMTTFCEGDQIILNVKTNSRSSETYTWKLNGVIIPTRQSGTTNSSDYTKKPATLSDHGTYTIDITNTCGTTANPVSIPVIVNPTPIVTFDIVGAATQCLSNNNFNFKNRTEVFGGTEISYTWDFGDGGRNTTAITTINKSYSTSGTFIVELTGINNKGCKNSTTRQVIVAASPRVIKQPIGKIVCQGSAYDLIAEVDKGGANSISYEWNFNGNPIPNSNSEKYSINSMSSATAGNYYLKISNAQCNLTDSSQRVTLSYQQKPNASFTAGGKSLSTCVNDAEFTFINTTPDVANVSYLWSIAEGITSNAKDFNYKFANTGIYNVTLTATAGGCSSTSVNPFGIENNRIIVNGLPTITKDLVSTKTIKKGDPLELLVEATSFKADASIAQISYNWYKMPSTNVVGSNTATFNAITSAVFSDTGRYYVNVSNACGFVRSNIITIKVYDKPSITLQPAATKACIDKSMQLIVEANSNDNSSPLYQWYFQQDLSTTAVPVTNTIGVTGATGPVLTITEFKNSRAGHYYVTLTNSIGATESDKAIVTANDVPQINSVVTTPSIESGICINTTLRLNASVSNPANSTNTISWEQNGVSIPGQTALQLYFASINKTNHGDLILKVANTCGTASKTMTINIIDLPQFIQSPAAVTACVDGSANFVAKVQTVADGTPFGFQWLRNGNNYIGTGIISDDQLSLSNLQAPDAGFYSLQASNVCGIKQSATGKLTVISTGPTITQQPAPISVCAGLQNTATVIASSDDNRLTYRWFKDGRLINGQINSQLIFPNITATDAGSYKATVTNGCNLSTTTTDFQVFVNEKIKLNESIADKFVCVGSDFEADISSNLKGADLSSSYQWQLNGINILVPSARTTRIQLLGVTKPNAGRYSILATNNCGASIINLFNLGVTNLPGIETHPIEGSVCENLDWTNKVVTSNPDQIGFTYQWFKDGVALSGAIQPILYVANTNSSNKGLYSVKLSSACGDVMSQSALLQVRPTPKIDISLVGTPPMQCIDNNTFIFKSNIIISDNSNVDLTWDFGDGVFSKQSQVSHSYAFANDFKAYLFAKSSFGCSDTAIQVVSVNNKPVITSNIVNQILCTSGQLNFSVDVKVKPNEQVGYQWYFNEAPIISAVNKSISIDNIQKVNAGSYKLRIINACGITYSNEAELKIAEKPLITVPLPINYKVCDGFETVLQPTIYSILPNTFQWYKNELPFVGRKSDTLRIKQFGIQDVATYSVSIENKCGTTFSIPGNLIMKNVAKSVQSLSSDTICYQTNTKLTIKDFTNNDDTLLFSWFKNGEKLIGSNTKEYNINKFIINDTGYYAAKLSNSCGALDVPIAKLTLNKVDAAFRLDTLDACKGTLVINGADTTRSIFAVRDNYWQIKELNRTLGSSISMRYQFSNSGTYTVRHAVTDIKGCNSDTVSKIVINYGKPTASFTINDTCMSMPSIALNNSKFGHASTKLTKYTWDFGDTTIIRNTNVVPAYTFKTAGPKTLQLVVESDSSCVADTLKKKMMVYGNPVASFVTQDSCQGFPVIFSNKSFTPFAPDSVVKFNWNFDDGTTSTLRNPQNIFKQYGAYKIKLTTYSASCPFLTDDTTINMTIKSPRSNQVYPRIQTVKRVLGQLDAIGNGRSYSWVPFTGLTDSKIRNPKFSLNDDKVNYTITIVDSAGCINTDKQEVWAFNKPDIYLATGFSPNNDGVNDRFVPEYVEIKILEYFKVHDNHNRQVFITNNLREKWDGTYNGNPLPPAPYLVTVAGIDILGNRIFKQGIVILVK
jgi:gliding motility-associated-like protein